MWSIRFLAVLAMVGSARGENLLANQTGTVIPPQTWTLLATRGWQPVAEGYDSLRYSPAANCSFMVGNYHEPANEEPNQGIGCYNLAQNNWQVLRDAGIFHDPYYATPGHNVGQTAWMPLYSAWYTAVGGSGSNQAERYLRPYWYDYFGQTAIEKFTGISPSLLPNLGNNTFNTANFDTFRNLVVNFPGPSGAVAIYDPSTSAYTYPSTSGTAPANTFWSSDYSSIDHKVYLFCGSDFSGSMFTFDAGSNTWATVSQTADPMNGTPTARQWCGWAYDEDDDLFLMVSGDSAAPAHLTDTWAFHRDTLTWERLATSGYISSINPSFQRLQYHLNDKTFVLLSAGDGSTVGGCANAPASTCQLLYAFPYAGAPNAGRDLGTYSPTAGYLSTKYTGTGTLPTGQVDETSVLGTNLVADGSGNLYGAWSESGSSYPGSSDTGSRHPYVKKWDGASWSYLGGLWNSLGDATGTESDIPHIAVGSAPWAAWGNNPGNSVAGQALRASSWNGSAWSTPTVVTPRNGGTWRRGVSAITAVGSTAYVASVEVQFTDGTGYLYVDSFTGSSTATVGGLLNFTQSGGVPCTSSSTCSLPAAVSITNDGTNPWVCWVEYGVDGNNFNPNAIPRAYCSNWTGSAWNNITGAALSGSGKIVGPDIATTYFAGHLYVAWTERTASGSPTLIVKQCTSSACTLIGSGLENGNGTGFSPWVQHPSLTNDGMNLCLGFEQQPSPAEQTRLYVKCWDGATWTSLGPALNADPTNGSVAWSSLAVASGSPVALWSETTPGNLRQSYAKRWNGIDWVALGSSIVTIPLSRPGKLTSSGKLVGGK